MCVCGRRDNGIVEWSTQLWVDEVGLASERNRSYSLQLNRGNCQNVGSFSFLFCELDCVIDHVCCCLCLYVFVRMFEGEVDRKVKEKRKERVTHWMRPFVIECMYVRERERARELNEYIKKKKRFPFPELTEWNEMSVRD